MNKLSGQGLIEYVFLLALLAIVVLIAVMLFGSQLRDYFNTIITDLSL